MAIQEKQVATELSALKRRFNPELYDFLVRLKEKADRNAKDIQDLLVGAQSGAPVTNAILTTKGDILAHDGSAQGRFPVGAAADGDVITRDAATPFGMKWATPTGGGAFPPLPNDESYFDDDFRGGADPMDGSGNFDASKSGSIGERGWSIMRFGSPHATSGVLAGDDGSFPYNPGVIAFNAGQASDRIAIYSPGASYVAADRWSYLAFDDVWFFFAIKTSTDRIYRIGVAQSTGSPADPPLGCYLELTEDVDTNFQFVWDDGTHNKTDSGVAPESYSYGSTKMVKLRMTHAEGAATVNFSINDGTPTAVDFYSDGDPLNWPMIGPWAEFTCSSTFSNSGGLWIDKHTSRLTGLSRYTPA